MAILKIGISGAHGSGKTTILHRVVADLKCRSIDAVLVPEAARLSPFLIAKRRSLASQLHVFLSHCEAEVRHELITSQVMLTDRTPVDMIAYTELFCPDEVEAISAMKAFSRWYMRSYGLVFVTTKLYDPRNAKDDFRPEDVQLQAAASTRIRSLLQEQCPSCVLLPEGPTDAQRMIVQQTCGLLGVHPGE